MSHGITIKFAILVSMATAGLCRCPGGFKEFNRVCHFIGSYVGNRYEADTKCRLMGGYLAVMDSELEFNHTLEIIKEKRSLADLFWIGGSFDGNTWVWQKTSPSDVTTTTPIDVTDPIVASFFGPNNPVTWLPALSPYLAIFMQGQEVNGRIYSENAFSLGQSQSYVCEADYVRDF